MGYGTRRITPEEVESVEIQALLSQEIEEIIPALEDEYKEINNDLNWAYYQEQGITPFNEIEQWEHELVYGKKKSMDRIFISQTLCKKIINKGQEELNYCPRYIREVFLLGNYSDLETEPMQHGKYFETLCLGSGAKGQKMTDLPRKRVGQVKAAQLRARGLPVIGDKTIDQIRIEQQAEIFRSLCQKNKVEIVPGCNTQLRIVKKWNDRFCLAGELDIFPTTILYEGIMRVAVIDLKLTSNVNTTWGKYCWGAPEYMDMLQADFYLHLIRDIDFDLNPHLRNIISEAMLNLIKQEQILFLYWVFGYQKEPIEEQFKPVQRLYRKNGTDIRQRELQERIRKTISCIERDEAKGFPENPDYENCKNCPVNPKYGGKCLKANKIDVL